MWSGLPVLVKNYVSLLEEFKMVAETIIEREGWGEPEEKKKLKELDDKLENHIGRYGGLMQKGYWREH